MLTGADLYRYIQDGIDQPYSGYLNPAKANRLIRECTIEAIEDRYRSPETQKQNDELSDVLVLDRSITVRDNRVSTVPLRITAFTVVGTTATITTSEPHQLLTGDTLTISDSAGFTPSLNGTYTVTASLTNTSLQFTVPTVTGTWTQGTGVVTHQYMLQDMMHPLAMRTTFVDGTATSIISVTNATAKVVFSTSSPIRTGTKIRIENALGVVGLNGDFYCSVKSRGGFNAVLYTDEALTTLATLSGTYQGGGTVRIIVSQWATKLFPDRRIAPSSDATPWRPKYGTDTSGLNIYPFNGNCVGVDVDYIRNPVVTIDASDTSVDLETYYSYKFLMHVKDRCATTWMLRMREPEFAAAQQQENNANR